MATVKDILAGKGSKIHTVPESVTVLEATRRMNDEKIGALVVMQDSHLTGIFTERDVMRKVVAEQLPPAEITVGDVMTTEVVCCSPCTPVDEASRIMKDRRVRHLPVCDDDGRLHGVISIGDLNAFYASDSEATIHFLHEYIYGRI